MGTGAEHDWALAIAPTVHVTCPRAMNRLVRNRQDIDDDDDDLGFRAPQLLGYSASTTMVGSGHS